MGKFAVFEIEATVTERGQTTVPAQVRKMLSIRKTGRVVFRGTLRPARGGGHAVVLRRTVADWPGTDTVVVRASTRTGGGYSLSSASPS